MIGATKVLATIGILAVSGALLVGQLAEEPAKVSPPGAMITSDLAPAYVDGTVEIIEEPEYEATEVASDYYEWTSPPVTLLWHSDDERLSGEGTAVEHGLQHFSSYTGVRTTWLTITNDGGSWSGPSNEFSREDGGQGFAVLTGHDGYEGLSAYLAIGPDIDDFQDDGPEAVRGVIFPAAPPTPPEAPAE